MREPQKKGFRDFLKKIAESASDAEKKFHGDVGRGVIDTAEKLGSKLPKALSPEEFSGEDMNKAIDAFRSNGLGKIGNQPKGEKYMEKPKDSYMNKPKAEKYMEKPKDGYMNKPSGSDGEYVNKYENDYGKIMKDYDKPIMLRNAPPSKGEIAAGRAVTLGGAAGASAAAAHSYWTQKKNENK